MNEIPWYHRIGTKLTISLLIFAVIVVGVLTLLIFQAFEQTRQAATDQSANGLLIQGRTSLLALTQREAAFRSSELERLADIPRYSAGAVSGAITHETFTNTLSLDALTLGEKGNRFDTTPNRLTDVVLFTRTPLNTATAKHVRASEVLNHIFPAMKAQHSAIAALFYVSPEGMLRYYPAIGVQDLVPPAYPITRQVYYTIAGPTVNPARVTLWSPPYKDSAGNGLLVTATAPVYADDEFHGIVAVDVPLERLVNDLGQVRPTQNGYAFLIDQNGKLIAAPPAALSMFFQAPTSAMPTITETLGLPLIPAGNEPLQEALTAMRAGNVGVQMIEVKGESLFVSYAPLDNINWTLVMVAPVSEVTREAQAVADTINNDMRETLRSVVLLLGGLVVISLLSTFLISRRLTNPINELVRSTRAIANDDFNISLPRSSKDELGLLARSFNHMTERLMASQAEITANNLNLERTVEERTHELQAERESLQQALDEIRAMNTVVAQLSTPIIPVLPGVIVAPIIGAIDRPRLDRIQEVLLSTVSKQQAHTVIIDVTGLDVLDVQVALALVEGLSALRLLGAHPILVGVHPDIAQHLIHSGVDLHNLETMPNLQAAVLVVLNRIRKR